MHFSPIHPRRSIYRGTYHPSTLCGIIAALIFTPSAAKAENEIWVYSGYFSQCTQKLSDDLRPLYGDLKKPQIGQFMHYGLRYTRWFNEDFGLGLEFTQSAYDFNKNPKSNQMSGQHMIYSNFLLNGMVRQQLDYPITPYAGLGIGLRHYNITHQPDQPEFTLLESFTGAAFVGVSYDIDDRYSLFAEVRVNSTLGTITKPESEIKGSIPANTSEAFNVGVSISF